MEELNFRIRTAEKTEPLSLPFSGTDPEGNTFSADGKSFLYNGKRIMPVMGEIHFSRMDPGAWEEALLKMKAGGITVAATYVFWNHHEEREGEWDFTGRRDLRAFLGVLAKTGLKCWLRIGPWAHGECRHGGFPDYVQYDDSFEKRTNDPRYLKLADILYGRIAEQVRGYLFSEGGPVIGIQLENEYGHCGGPADRAEQKAHMEMLLSLAKKNGLIVPFYSATAWGGACTLDETLQVLSDYVDAPWDDSTERLPVQDNFLFLPYRDDANTGSDFEKEAANGSVIRRDYPYLTAELGGGLQVTSHRRPITSGADNAANILCCLGSGANLIGYYMYHGGTNPDGKYSTLNEAQDIGGNTTVPVKSYDFDACLNEAGRRSESYGTLKKYHLLMECFGEELSEADTCFPEERPSGKEDFDSIRAAVRYNKKTGAGFLFVNNHVRYETMRSHTGVTVNLDLDGEKITLSGLSFQGGHCYVIPFGLKNGEKEVPVLNASLLARLGDRLFFYSDAGTASSDPRVTVLSEEEADRAFLFEDGLYITEAPDSVVIEREGRKYLISERETERILIIDASGAERELTVNADAPLDEGRYPFRKELLKQETGENGRLLYRDYKLELPLIPEEPGRSLFLRIDYLGDRAELRKGDRLYCDWFTTGKTWHIKLKDQKLPRELVLRVYDSDNTIPCRFGQKVFYDLPVKPGCALISAGFSAEYETEIS